MNVILCEDVVNLGEMGQTVKVAPGYARNFLIPRKMAVNAESASAREIEHQMRIIKKREIKRREELQKVAAELINVTLDFHVKAGEGDKLFGSVTTSNIAEKLKEAGFVIDRRSVKLDEPIKALGAYVVAVKLGSGVEGKVNVRVERDATEDATAAAVQAELAAAEADDAAHEAAERAERGQGGRDDRADEDDAAE